MAVLTGPVYVPNPVARTLRYGLFTVANGPLDMPAHGADGGVTYLGASCGEALGYEINCIDSLVEKGPFIEPLDNAVGAPFSVTAGFECGPVGISQAERDALTLAKFEALEQAAVEKIFSEGTFGIEPSLANNTPAASDVGPAASLVEAVSQLEENFYDTYGFPGTIHVPHVASAFLHASQAVYLEGGIWRTMAGSMVSVGNYSGLSPAGADPGANQTWVYITPPVTIWRDNDVFITPIEGALDRSTNEVTMYAEREYVLTHDPCPVFATQATLSEGS